MAARSLWGTPQHQGSGFLLKVPLYYYFQFKLVHLVTDIICNDLVVRLMSLILNWTVGPPLL